MYELSYIEVLYGSDCLIIRCIYNGTYRPDDTLLVANLACKLKRPFFRVLFGDRENTEIAIKMIKAIHLYCLLLRAQRCCYLLVEKVANKIQESAHSKEYYQEEVIKPELYKRRQCRGQK